MKLEVYFNDGSEMIEIPVTSEEMAGEEVSKMVAAGGAMMERLGGWTFKPMTTVLKFKFTNTPPETDAGEPMVSGDDSDSAVEPGQD